MCVRFCVFLVGCLLRSSVHRFVHVCVFLMCKCMLVFFINVACLCVFVCMRLCLSVWTTVTFFLCCCFEHLKITQISQTKKNSNVVL